jgi:hypothetical protein
MNDGHNLGMSLSDMSLEIPLLILLLSSLEVDACIERLGKAFIAKNSE